MNITPILVMNIHNLVSLNICLYFRSYSPSLNSAGNKTKKNLSALISFGLKKSVGLNIFGFSYWTLFGSINVKDIMFGEVVKI